MSSASDMRSDGPTFDLEAAARARLAEATPPRAPNQTNLRICGIDEAGRGPLAGPVIAAAVAFDAAAPPPGLNDSKKLTAARRTELFDALRAAAETGAVDIAVGAASVREIDALNILRANDLAMRRAVRRLRRRPDWALIDGNRTPPDLGCAAEAVVKGDARSLSIAAASIVAKVMRDRIMMLLARRHPEFAWSRNAGYPTAEHRAALARCGPSPHHRTSFATVRAAQIDDPLGKRHQDS